MKKTNRQIDSSSSSVYFSVCMCTRLYEIFICISPEGLLFSGDFRGKKSGIYELVSLFYNFFLSLLEIHVCIHTHTRAHAHTHTHTHAHQTFIQSPTIQLATDIYTPLLVNHMLKRCN